MILYPHDKISTYQRQQMTNIAFNNVIPLAIEGCFDDCQSIAKSILTNATFNTCSGNSINILRLIAQTVYYFWLAKDIKDKYSVVVPTGNLGNAVAAVMAKKMGAPIDNIIIAVNHNSLLSPDIIKGVTELPNNKPIKSLSTAMDVCIPNNLLRLRYLCPIWDDVKDWLHIEHVSEEATTETILDTFRNETYPCDPHTAVGIAAANRHLHLSNLTVLSTAAPIKFLIHWHNLVLLLMSQNHYPKIKKILL